MLIIKRTLRTGHRQQRYRGGNVFTNIIKRIANKVTAQKVVDAVVNGGIRAAGDAAAKGTKFVAESALKRVLPQQQQNNKSKNKNRKIDTVTALINGSGIIYD